MEGLATDNNVRLPSCRCRPARSWLPGTAPRRGVSTGGALHFAHRFSLYLRAAEQDSGGTYADLFWLLVSAITIGRSVVVIASAFPDRSRLLPDGSGSAVGPTKTVVVSADGQPSITLKFKQRWSNKASGGE